MQNTYTIIHHALSTLPTMSMPAHRPTIYTAEQHIPYLTEYLGALAVIALWAFLACWLDLSVASLLIGDLVVDIHSLAAYE